MTLPKTTLRPGMVPYTDAQCAHIRKISPRIVVHRPEEDMGPALKYMGAESTRRETKATHVFVCDDDQTYHPDLLVAMLVVQQQHPRAVVQNRLDYFRRYAKGGRVHGYVGVLMPLVLIDGIGEFVHRVPKEVRLIDDQIVTAFWWFRGVHLASGVEELKNIFSVLVNGRERLEVATALHSCSNRTKLRQLLYESVGLPKEVATGRRQGIPQVFTIPTI